MKQPNKVTFLGPVGATFSHVAYDILAREYGAPSALDCIPAGTNGEVLKLTLGHGGYGAIAMETLAEGRVAEPLESFIELLASFEGDSCPLHVLGAIKLELHFCLMAGEGVGLSSITKIVAHPKALGACKKRIAALRLPAIQVSSNGEAARLVAEDGGYATCAALGPVCAASKYGLQMLHDAYEDGKAITTFFLLGPKEHGVRVGENNRALIVFRLKHEPDALAKALHVLGVRGLNLIQIHSMHVGNCTYDFAIEVEVGDEQIRVFEDALREMRKMAARCLCFGPFEVLCR